MMTFNDEQFEDAVVGLRNLPAGMEDSIRREVATMQAVRNRLHRANLTVTAPDGLAERIATQLGSEAVPTSADAPPSAENRLWKRLKVYAVPLAAAAMLVLAVGVWLATGSESAQADFYRIHQETLKDVPARPDGQDPSTLAQALRERLGEPIVLPKLTGDCAYLGGRVDAFRDRAVAGMLVRVGSQRVTVLQIPDTPTSLGFSHEFSHQGRTWHNCQYADCKLLAVRAGGQTFVVIGEVEKDRLMGLLEQFVAEAEPCCPN
jgi:hypothetical protein